MLRSPSFLLLGVWALVGVIVALAVVLRFIAIPREISTAALAAIVLALVGVGGGELLARLAIHTSKPLSHRDTCVGAHSNSEVAPTRAIPTLVVILILSAVGYVSFLDTWSVVDLFIDSQASEAFLKLNQQFAEKTEAFGGLLGRLYVLPVIGLALTSYLAGRRTIGTWSAGLFVICFVFMLVSPRRALLLQGIILAVLIYREAGGRRTAWALGATAVLALTVFIATQMILSKTDATVEGALAPIFIYVGANIPTMEMLSHTNHFASTNVTLNVPFRIVNVLFGKHFPVELDVPFVDVGALSNTVPFQYYLFRDAGLLGVLVVSLLFGFLAYVAFRRAAIKNTFGAVWAKCALAVFIIFSFREFTLITYDWIFFFAIATVVSIVMHNRSRSRP